MAFLDNSGDIILDAVLTDTGRMRLAKGDGSFRVAKFALGDDEVDYSLFNYANPSGSAYYDLEILQTPVLEAFSNNGSSMKSKLISIAKNNLLYLPVMQLDTYAAPTVAAKSLINEGYLLTADLDTTTYFESLPTYNSVPVIGGVIYGNDNTITTKYIKIDQGLDTTEIPATTILDPDLKETQYLIEIDNRFAVVCTSNPGTRTPATPSYIDDDNIATYYFSRGVDTQYVSDITATGSTSQVIAGPRGTALSFSLLSQAEVSTSDYLFNQLGTELKNDFSGSLPVDSIKGILTNVRVTGVTTGNSIDIPLLVVKKISP